MQQQRISRSAIRAPKQIKGSRHSPTTSGNAKYFFKDPSAPKQLILRYLDPRWRPKEITPANVIGQDNHRSASYFTGFDQPAGCQTVTFGNDAYDVIKSASAASSLTLAAQKPNAGQWNHSDCLLPSKVLPFA